MQLRVDERDTNAISAMISHLSRLKEPDLTEIGRVLPRNAPVPTADMVALLLFHRELGSIANVSMPETRHYTQSVQPSRLVRLSVRAF